MEERMSDKPIPEMPDSSCSEQAREIVGECPSLGFKHVAIVECAKRLAAEAERDALRATLIAVGRNLGCLLADTVSTEFLQHLAEESALFAAAHPAVTSPPRKP
jgi:hypothetical protein